LFFEQFFNKMVLSKVTASDYLLDIAVAKTRESRDGPVFRFKEISRED